MTSKWRKSIASLFSRPLGSRQIGLGYRKLQFEAVEDRRMLANQADIIFLVDKSASPQEEYTWIANLVSQANGLDDYLSDPARDIDARYGLIGFGDGALSYGHSHLLDSTDSNSDGDRLFGTAAQLADVVADVDNTGGHYEQAWDAMEHAIAEYEFRPGAAVIFVMFRRDDVTGAGPYFVGNEPENELQPWLTHTGTLAALNSYNVTLNSVVEVTFDPAMYASTGGIVLGVEADGADWVENGQHIAHVVNGVVNRPTEPDVLLVSQNGTNSGTYLDTGKSIRISTSAAAQIVGPNGGGYKAEAVTYAFENIATTGTKITGWAINPTGGHYKQITPSNLTFSYYGTSYSGVYVNTDGTITFDGWSAEYQDYVDWSFSPPMQARIAPLWDVFDTNNESYEGYWQVKDDGLATERLIVQWSGLNPAPDSGSGPTETVTFQAVLYANGDIRFNYLDLDLTDGNFTEGRNAIVGISGERFLAPSNIPAGVFVDGVHLVESTEFYGAEDDFVRLSWETGGAAWNNDVISGGSSSYSTQFDTAFIQSIGRQIADKHARGDVVFAEEPVIQINLGGPAVGSYIADTNPILGANFLSSGSTLLNTTQTIAKNGNSMAGDLNTLAVFKSARAWGSPGGALNIPATILPDGRYVVELMFASIPDDGVMSVTFENAIEPALRDYNAETDVGKIPATSGGAPEYEVLPDVLGSYTPIVKRFSVDVADGNGLTIALDGSASINGLRILRTPPPRVKDVIIKGTNWAPGVEYSFQELVSLGQQLRPIPTQNANTIEIHFDGPVTLPANGSALRLARSIRDASDPQDPIRYPLSAEISGTTATYSYDPDNYIARWTFPAAGANRLQDGKYALLLDSGAVTGGGRMLDGEWNAYNSTMGAVQSVATPDTWSNDAARAFLTGNGTAGSGTGDHFRLNFALLAGDYNGDGIVTTTGMTPDTIVAGDRWSDGNGDGFSDVAGAGQDAGVRTANANDFLPLRQLYGADSIDDELVDGGDFNVWRAMFAINGVADITGDGNWYGDDLLAVQEMLGSKSAWSTSLAGFAGSAASVFGPSSSVDGAAAPRVMNVIVSGSISMHAPFSFDTVDGSGAQIRTVPVGGADTISIVFSENVNVLADSLIVIGMTTFNLPELAAFSYDAATFTATWRYDGWALGDNYLLALSDGVTDVDDGNWLDGEWTNPANATTVNAAISEFPSGNGTPGGWFKFAMTLMPGDANLDNVVDSTDASIWYSHWGQQSTPFIWGDYNGDGTVNTTDWPLYAANQGLQLQTLSFRTDFDGDLDVDAADLDRIADNAGMTGATWADGDLDGDGEVTLDDLDLALTQYGWGISVVS